MKERKVTLGFGIPLSVILLLCSLAPPSSRIGSLAASVSAQPTSVPDVRELVRESTTIVVGRVSDIHEAKTAGRQLSNGDYAVPKIGSLRVYDVLKGEIKGRNVEVEYREGHSTNGVYPNEYWVMRNEYAVFFLQRRHDSIYKFADSHTAAIPVTSVEVPSTAASHSAEAKVELYLFASLSDPDPNLAEAALRWVNTLTYSTKIRMKGAQNQVEKAPIFVLQQLASSPDPEVQGLAFAALVKMGDRSILTRAMRFAETPTKNPRAQYWKSRIITAIGRE